MEIRKVPGCEVPYPIQCPQALFTTTEHIGPAGGHDGSSYTVAAAFDGLGQAADAQAERMVAPFARAIGRQPFPTALAGLDPSPGPTLAEVAFHQQVGGRCPSALPQDVARSGAETCAPNAPLHPPPVMGLHVEPHFRQAVVDGMQATFCGTDLAGTHAGVQLTGQHVFCFRTDQQTLHFQHLAAESDLVVQ